MCGPRTARSGLIEVDTNLAHEAAGGLSTRLPRPAKSKKCDKTYFLRNDTKLCPPTCVALRN